jgi:uncharacterized membrane protein YozB (DUF420 family)
MAQVHITKVIAEPVPQHESAPAMEADLMKALPAAMVAVVTVLLIASVCSCFLKRGNATAHTNEARRSATLSERSSHPWL